MNTGGSYHIKEGKRVKVEHTQPQQMLTHEQKIALAKGEQPQKSQPKSAKNKG